MTGPANGPSGAPVRGEMAARLLAYLRRVFDDGRLDYAAPPRPLEGGSHARCYRFALRGAAGGPARPLVLRLYRRGTGTSRAAKEALVQKALAGRDYPVPRVYAVCTDTRVLGGAFLVMEFMPGETMLHAPSGAPELLGESHAALHDLDPAPVIDAMRTLEGRPAADRYRLEAELAAMAAWSATHPQLRPAIDWLAENRPPPAARPAICHGDFHPLNLLVRNGTVTGALDWSGFLIADPMLDVACTQLLLSLFGPRPLPRAEAGRSVAERYLAAYRRRRPLAAERLAYFRIRRCIIGLADAAAGLAMWRAPAVVERVAGEIRSTTGIDIATP